MPGPRRIDLTGQRFGRLTVLQANGRNIHSIVLWECRCDCGETTTTSSTCLRSGDTKSCGCYKKDSVSARSFRHGKHRTRAYRTWISMRYRCRSPQAKQWSDYGGRDIKVCERWNTFENFYDDMGDPPPCTSIDRIDVNGNYEPGNVRWASSKTQSNNQRDTVRVNFNGKSMTLPEWAEEIGISSIAMYRRHKRGDVPPHLFRPYALKGKVP